MEDRVSQQGRWIEALEAQVDEMRRGEYVFPPAPAAKQWQQQQQQQQVGRPPVPSKRAAPGKKTLSTSMTTRAHAPAARPPLPCLHTPNPSLLLDLPHVWPAHGLMLSEGRRLVLHLLPLRDLSFVPLPWPPLPRLLLLGKGTLPSDFPPGKRLFSLLGYLLRQSGLE